MNDLFDSLPKEQRTNKLSLLYETNCKTMVAVNTPFGLTERVEVNKIVEQGGVWGPIECANSIDTFGKECELEGKFMYEYKQNALKNHHPPNIPPLGYINDLLGVAKC